MNIIGLDLSLTATGIATHAGTGIVKATTTGVLRLGSLRRQVIDVVVGAMAHEVECFHCIGETIVAVEGYAFARPNQAHQLGELGGVIRLALHDLDVTFVDVAPKSLKKFATGKGNATKPDMRMARLVRSGVDERDDNQNDAWWLRALACEAYGEPIVELPAEQRKVVRGIAWPEMAGVSS